MAAINETNVCMSAKRKIHELIQEKHAIGMPKRCYGPLFVPVVMGENNITGCVMGVKSKIQSTGSTYS